MKILIRQLGFFFFISLSFFMGSCNDDVNNFDPTKDPLVGMIGGKEWTYGSGNVNYSNFSSYMLGLIVEDDLEDPCAVVITNKAHISIQFPSRRGNYNLPLINNEGNTADVIFNLSGGATKYSATSGFIEIVEITSTEIFGYISADYDENNYVKGAFVLKVCY